MTHAEKIIQEQAVRWLVKLEDDVSPDEWAEFDAWIADPLHRAAYLRLSQAWRRAQAIRHLRPLDGTVDPDFLISSQETSECNANQRLRPKLFSSLAGHLRSLQRLASAHPRRVFAAAAAGVAVTVAVAIGLTQWRPHSDPPDLYSTSLGATEEFTLRDGSSMVLNTSSEVRVQFTAHSRDITIVQGEALFEVASNPDRPFQVHTDTAIVRATGTAFTVRLQPQTRNRPVSTDVLVTEGTVEIIRSTDRRPISLTAGRSANIMVGRVTLSSINLAEIDDQLAWIQGQVVFDRDPLSAVVVEFNRYNARKLQIDDPSIASTPITGRFKATDLDSFLAALNGLDIRPKGDGATFDSPIQLARSTNTKITP